MNAVFADAQLATLLQMADGPFKGALAQPEFPANDSRRRFVAVGQESARSLELAHDDRTVGVNHFVALLVGA